MFAIDAPQATLVGAALATCGWVYTGRRARTLAKKQHTISVMLQASFNSELQTARVQITPFLREGRLMELQLPGRDEDVLAFRRVANHYEFVAAGLRNGDFDERLIRDSERASIVTFFEKSEEYIRSLRNVRRRTAIYEHLEWLSDRWERKRPGHLQKMRRVVHGPPLGGARVNTH